MVERFDVLLVSAACPAGRIDERVYRFWSSRSRPLTGRRLEGWQIGKNVAGEDKIDAQEKCRGGDKKINPDDRHDAPRQDVYTGLKPYIV